MESVLYQKAWITEIVISDGTSVQLPKSGVVLIVGPNNAGKSQALRDIQGILRDLNNNYQPRCVINQTLQKDEAFDITPWVEENIPSVVRDGTRNFHVPNWGQIPAQQIADHWTIPRLGLLTDIFLLLANGLERLTIGNAEPAIDYMREIPTGPIQRAYSDPELENEISQQCKRAFGMEVVVDRYAGSVVPLRLGTPPAFEHESGRPKKEYLERLRELPQLAEQGDGIRSYMGLILNVLAGVHDMILIDEPEAFLHPPQARLLSRTLGQRADHQQVFMATHSTAIVQGALEADNPTTIIRLTRKGTVNHAAVLREEDVTELWSDPLLRYSNVLDGLFHDAVVLCESDSDCKYYQAILDAIDQPAADEIGKAGSIQNQQILFTHSGGKARLSSVLDALSAVKVPVVVVADFDMLREKGDVEKLVKSAGGTFEGVIEPNLTVLQSALKPSKPLRKTALKDALVTAMDASDETLSSKDLENIRAIVRAETGWDKAKRAGKSAVPQGDAYVACEVLISALADLGILIVPVGELEGFERTVGGHGPAWVAEVLSRGLHKTPKQEALAFGKAIKDACSRQSEAI